MKSKELREQVAALIKKARDVVDQAETEKRKLTAEDQEAIQKIHTDAADLNGQARVLEDQEKLEANASQFAGGSVVDGNAGTDSASTQAPDQDTVARNAFTGWVFAQSEQHELITDQHRSAMASRGMSAQNNTLKLGLPTFYRVPTGVNQKAAVLNALSVGSDTAGGYTVPTGFVDSLEVALLQFNGMRNAATILRTSTGEPLPWPTTDDTSNEGALVSENTAIDTDGTDVSFGSKTFNAYEYTSQFVRVSNQLIRDSRFNIPELLARLLGERLGRIQARHGTTGDGAAKPFGITIGAATGVTAASSTAITADEILEFIHSIDPAYRSSPGVSFMMHDQIMLQVSLLKDGENNYLLRPGLETGNGNTLRSYPVINNQSMASAMATGAKVMLFGDLSKYIIREVGSIRLQRLSERFAEYNQTAFLAFMSFDGGLVDAGTHPVKLYVMK